MTATAGQTASAWWVYLLICADDTCYVGIARDLRARLREHNGELRGGARYTRGRRPVSLHAACPCADRREASRLEHRVKQLRRAEKLALIAAAGWLPAPQALAAPARVVPPDPAPDGARR